MLIPVTIAIVVASMRKWLMGVFGMHEVEG
jgi:hypothetical protein